MIPTFGTLDFSDYNQRSANNDYGWQYPIYVGPGTLEDNVLSYLTASAVVAKGYGNSTVILWDAFGGSKFPHRGAGAVGYVDDILDAAPGLSIDTAVKAAAILSAHDLRAGVIVRPTFIVPGLNGGAKCVYADPVNTLLGKVSQWYSMGYRDFYLDSNSPPDIYNNLRPLAAGVLSGVTGAFPSARFIAEHHDDSYKNLPNVFSLRYAKRPLASNRPSAVVFGDDEDVTTPAMQKALQKRLGDTRSVVLMNCRPDDPAVSKRNAELSTLVKGL